MAIWRVGTKLGRTLYKDDRCVGMVDTPELAAEIVSAMTRADEMLRAEFPDYDMLPGCGGPSIMDAPGGPVCSCGQPSRHESGWCGRTGRCYTVDARPEAVAAVKERFGMLPVCTCTRGIGFPTLDSKPWEHHRHCGMFRPRPQGTEG